MFGMGMPSMGMGMGMMPMMGMGMGMGMMPMMGMGMNPMMAMMQQAFVAMQMMQMMQMMMGGQMGGGCGCGMPNMGMGGMMGMPNMGGMMGMPNMGGMMGMGNNMGGMMGMPGYGYPSFPSFPTFPSYPGMVPGYDCGCGRPGMSQGGIPIDLSQVRGGTPFGRQLAQDAFRHANGPGGYCLRWVSNDLERHGVCVHGCSAYQAADQLAHNNKFQEASGIRNDQLKKLPPGAVVVWDRGPGHPHGHISVAGGNGMEASDRVRPQITNYGTSFRVFLPK